MFKKILASLVLFGAAFSVHAAFFQGISSGTFNNPTGGTNMVVTGVGTNSFTWGTGVNRTSPSSLQYSGNSFSVDKNAQFVIGTLNYYNGTVYSGTGATSVDLNIDLQFISPNGMNEAFSYDLGLINTTNTSDPFASADFVKFNTSVSSSFFSAGGIDYTLEFLGFGILNGQGFTAQDSFHVLEGGSANVQLVGRITAVPVPAAVWLFGSGIAGLIGASKRKKSIAVITA